jgi:hypothetical protein
MNSYVNALIEDDCQVQGFAHERRKELDIQGRLSFWSRQPPPVQVPYARLNPGFHPISSRDCDVDDEGCIAFV